MKHCKSYFFRLSSFLFVVVAGFFALLWFTPLSAGNFVLPNHLQLINPQGNINQGSWEGINIKGKNYQLSCHYQRQSLDINGADYQLNCDAPLSITATVGVSTAGIATVQNARVQGNIADAADWQKLAGLPVSISGQVDMTIVHAEVSRKQVNYLDINGQASSLEIFNQVLLNSVSISTSNPKLSENQPIQLQAQSDVADNSGVSLNANSAIDGQNYLTRATLSGARLKQYEKWLALFAEPDGENRFSMTLQGRLF